MAGVAAVGFLATRATRRRVLRRRATLCSAHSSAMHCSPSAACFAGLVKCPACTRLKIQHNLGTWGTSSRQVRSRASRCCDPSGAVDRHTQSPCSYSYLPTAVGEQASVDTTAKQGGRASTSAFHLHVVATREMYASVPAFECVLALQAVSFGELTSSVRPSIVPFSAQPSPNQCPPRISPQAVADVMRQA